MSDEMKVNEETNDVEVTVKSDPVTTAENIVTENTDVNVTVNGDSTPASDETKTETKTEKKTKKSWFNRAWSAMTGLVIGIASMLGINKTQVDAIKTQAENTYKKVQEIQIAIENKDISGALDAVTEAQEGLKQITGEIKEATDTIKNTVAEYKTDIEAIRAAIEAKNYKEAHELAVLFADVLTDKVPVDQMSGGMKTLYDAVKTLIADIEAGKYDNAVEACGKILKLETEEEKTE